MAILCREEINKKKIDELCQHIPIAFLSTKFGREKCIILSAKLDSIEVETLRGKALKIKLVDIMQIDFLEMKELWELLREGNSLRLSFQRSEILFGLIQ